MSSISVSAENLEALLHSSRGRPGAEAGRAPEHSASVSAEALEALLPPEKREAPVARPVAPPVEVPKPAVEQSLPLLAARDRERIEQARSTQPRATPRPSETPRPAPQPVAQPARPTPLPPAPSVNRAPVANVPAPGVNRAPVANVPAPIAESVPANANNKRRTMMAVGAVAIVLLGLGTLFVRGRKTAPPQVVAPPVLVLQLGAETLGSGLVNVRWNPESVLVTKAQSGRLVIKEGDQQPRTVTLAQAELKTGHLLYQSPADHLEFRLETVEPSGFANGETIVVEIPKAAQTIASNGTPNSPGQTANQPGRPAGTAAPQPATPVDPAAQAVNPPVNPPAPKPQPKTFTLPAPQARHQPARGGVLLDAPGAVPGPTAVGLPSASLPTGAFSAPPPPAPAPQPRTGGDLQAAVLIRKVAPVYPPLAKAARIQGAVRFSATVGKDGHLVNLQVMGGHSALVQAATDAVKQWVYRPTMLNGEPVEVVTQLEVNFTLNDAGGR